METEKIRRKTDRKHCDQFNFCHSPIVWFYDDCEGKCTGYEKGKYIEKSEKEKL